MRQTSNAWLRILIGIFVVTAVAARLLPGPRTIDDAHITYRYARNIVAGEGFVYNPGERVLGTTTPLYTLLLAGFAALNGETEANFPAIALGINALADALTVLLLWKLGRRLGYLYAGAGTALIWAIAPFSVTFAIGGLETSLYVLLLTGTAYAHLRKQHGLAALLAAFSLLTRPDALILLGPLALDRAFHLWPSRKLRQPADARPSSTTLELAAFGLPAAIWFGCAAYYFGSPVPHSILAKSLAYRLPDSAAFIRLLQHYATPFLGQLTFGVWWIAVGLVLYPFFSVIGGRAILKISPRIWPWLAYPWLYFAAFAIAHPLIFRWYLTPPLPAYIFFIFVGMEQIFRTIVQPDAAQSGQPRWGVALLGVMILLPAVLTLRGWELKPNHGPERPAPKMAWFELELLYRQAAEIVSQNIRDHPNPALPLLAAGDVGVLGYYTPTNILDTVGLNSPQALPYYPLDESLYTISYAVPPDLIFDQQPDYIVLLEVYGRLGLFTDPRFPANYQLLENIATDIYGSDGMLVFTRIP